MKGAIVFGGAGFIGTHLLRTLAESGAPLRLVSVDIVAPGVSVPGVEYVIHDIRTPIPDRFAAGIDRIYDLAAVHRTPGHKPHEYYETNVAGAVNACAFARRNDLSEMLFTSSIAVYGPGEDRKLETTTPVPTSDYGRSKLLAEHVRREWQEADGARKLAIVRPAVIFGAGERGNFTRLAGALKRGMFLYPGRRDTVKSCGYVGELVRSMDFVMTMPERSILYNFCYARDYTIEDICNTFGEVAGLPAPRGVMPHPLMNTAAVPFEIVSKLGLRNGIDRERIAKLVTSTNVEPGFLNAAGYRYETDLAEAIRRWRAESPALV
ncbi:UDP-N-acetylglucosamine 4-epimerase [Aureimonas endophytica]|uniref:UDP-N-acetylglucosamine 4-epimerase n=1 Tax=Aureimonas endophytica TaxID=2027858 RepID=A0A916ZJK5_9HYPH|nr:NAD(P)-dependent oxidoreductase [Aureimonas endophytica]GGE01080.1 UDP-N-acetylglucosamine 4-epimerase [Aureimonas endophytica]